MTKYLIRQYIDLLESSNKKDTSLSFFKLLEAESTQKSLMSIVKEILAKHNTRVGVVYYDTTNNDKTKSRVKIHISNNITASIIQEIVTTLTDNGFTIYKCIDDVDDYGSPVLKIYYLKIKKVEKEKTDDERKFLEIREKIEKIYIYKYKSDNPEVEPDKSIQNFISIIEWCDNFEYHYNDYNVNFLKFILKPSLLSQGYSLVEIANIIREFNNIRNKASTGNSYKEYHAIIVDYIKKYKIDVPKELDICIENIIQEYQPIFQKCLELYKEIPNHLKSKLKANKTCKEVMQIVFRYIRNT